MQIGRPEEKDIDVVVRTVEAFRLPVKKPEAYEIAGVSAPETGDEVIEASEPEAERPEDASKGEESRQSEDSPPGADPVVTVDRLAAEAELGAAGAMDALLELIGSLVADPTIRTIEDLRGRLMDMAPQLSTRSLALALRQARVVARCTGRAEIADG